MKLIVLICVVGSVVGKKDELVEKLPEYMLGHFKMETSEGFTDFMYEMGVDWFKRSIACTLYPLQKISQDEEGTVMLDTDTTFKSTKTSFKLGQTWDEYTADGRYTTTVASVDGNKLVKVQTPEKSTGYYTTTEVREYVDDGNTMNLILTINGVEGIKSTRVYKRVPVPVL